MFGFWDYNAGSRIYLNIEPLMSEIEIFQLGIEIFQKSEFLSGFKIGIFGFGIGIEIFEFVKVLGFFNNCYCLTIFIYLKIKDYFKFV